MIVALLLIAIGAYILFRARVWIMLMQRTQARRLEDRLTRGEDAYDGELRTLQTFKPVPMTVRLVRLCGAAMIALGAADLIYLRVS